VPFVCKPRHLSAELHIERISQRGWTGNRAHFLHLADIHSELKQFRAWNRMLEVPSLLITEIHSVKLSWENTSISDCCKTGKEAVALWTPIRNKIIFQHCQISKANMQGTIRNFLFTRTAERDLCLCSEGPPSWPCQHVSVLVSSASPKTQQNPLEREFASSSLKEFSSSSLLPPTRAQTWWLCS